jgi:uncharacterized protein YkwD
MGDTATRHAPMVRILLLIAALFIPSVASADLIDGVNDIRHRGCGGARGVPTTLKRVSGLNDVAREWSRGGRLREALPRTDYRAVNSASMRVEGTTDDRAILNVLRNTYCETILDPSITEIGMYRRDRNVWIVVAAPFSPPTPRDATTVAQNVLELVNRARARDRKCGATPYRAVPPLASAKVLDRAALVHAQDMAAHSMFEHRGTDGSTPAERATRAGYVWRSVGENIAAGAADAESVTAGWLDSPGHCANIMSPAFTEMGIAYAVNNKSKSGIYWSQVFAAPAITPKPGGLTK